MSYTLPFTFQLGAAKTGQAANMRARFLDTTGTPTGSVISAGFFESPGNLGNYGFYPTIADGFVGFLRIYHATDATIELLYGVDPQEYENTDEKVSTRLATTGYTEPPTLEEIRIEMDTHSSKLALLGAAQIVITSPVSTSGDLNIKQGDSYTDPTVDWGPLVLSESTGAWQKYVGKASSFIARSSLGMIFSTSATITDVNGTVANITVALTSAETSTFTYKDWQYEIQVEGATDKDVTPLNGTMSVQRDLGRA